MLKSIALIVLLALAALPAFAQRFTYPSELARTLDSLDRTASEGLFRHAQNENGTAIASSPALAGAELKVMPVSSFASYNSSFPFGDDDGALWQGRGISGISRAGAEIAWDWASIRFDPEWWFAQNQDYTHASPYLTGSATGDYTWGLDRLQSYGSGFYQSFGWGQSEVRLRYGGFTLGFGTENLKLGPAEIQNIILSDNASGFPLLDIGTDGPISTWLGSFDARFFWGQTELSQWYDSDTSTNKFLWCGGDFSYSPPFLKNMSFGFIRAFHSPWSTMDGWKIFEFFDDTVWKNFRNTSSEGIQSNGEDDVDQVLSLTWEWRIPQTGSRFYLEWSRNDASADFFDFLMQPEHSGGYTAGIQQKITVGNLGRVLVSAEIAQLGDNIGTTIRPTGSWYRHSLLDNGGVDGGYTEDGQILGAPMGPGSNSQEINVYFLRDPWYLGLGFQRMVMDADYFYTYAQFPKYDSYNLLLTETLRLGLRVMDKLELGSALALTTNFNHNFTPDTAQNWHIELSLKYTP